MSDSHNSKKELYEKYDKQIDDLYSYRDKYYILNENSRCLDDRNNTILAKLNQLVNEIETTELSKFESKSSQLVLIGKAFNCLPDFNQKSFDSLTKAIKLDPKSIEGWNNLAECYWKQRDFEMCKNCFEQSLNINKNKHSLRGLSMVMRQLINVPSNKEELQQQEQNQLTKYERIKNLLDESIKYAKESLQLDPKDGISWYILANCYVSKFFSPFGSQNTTLLKQAISSYNLALKDESASFQSDLYFNKSMISMYEENWLDVLLCLCKALNLDPFWTEVRDNLKGTINYLMQLNEMVSTKGKLKSKKFQVLIDSIKKTDLGPYSDGFIVKTDEQVKDSKPNKIELVESKLADLEKGYNKNKVLVAKVIAGLPSKNSEFLNIVCFTCCIADANGDCAVLTIYNLAGGHGLLIGQSVAIPEPFIEKVEFKFSLEENLKNKSLIEETQSQDGLSDQLVFKFNSVRVEYPTVLVVNGKKWTKEKVSTAFFVPKVISD